MNIIIPPSDTFPVKAGIFKPNIHINIDFIKGSDNNFTPIDRGIQSDYYYTELTFTDSYDIINELWTKLKYLRDNQYEVELENCDDNYFGDHIDYSQNIKCLIDNISKLESKKFNTYTFSVTLLASSLHYIGTNQLPSGLKCLNQNYTKTSEWNTHINSTYYRNNYYVDRVRDDYIFEGTYILHKDENKDLFYYWSNVRGNTIHINELYDFGVNGMFGPDITNTEHFVIINNITYDIYSPIYRKVKIELLRQE